MKVFESLISNKDFLAMLNRQTPHLSDFNSIQHGFTSSPQRVLWYSKRAIRLTDLFKVSEANWLASTYLATQHLSPRKAAKYVMKDMSASSFFDSKLTDKGFSDRSNAFDRISKVISTMRCIERDVIFAIPASKLMFFYFQPIRNVCRVCGQIDEIKMRLIDIPLAPFENCITGECSFVLMSEFAGYSTGQELLPLLKNIDADEL